MKIKLLVIGFIALLLISSMYVGLFTIKEKSSSISGGPINIVNEYDWGYIEIDAVKKDSLINFSEYIKFLKLPENASFVSIKWDFEGDGIIDWTSYDNPYFYIDENGNKIYPIYKYNCSGLYEPKAVCWYYEYGKRILYKIIVKPYMNYVIVYSDEVDCNSVLSVKLNIKKRYVHINTTENAYIGWSITFENIGDNPICLLYAYGAEYQVLPNCDFDVYMITQEGHIITYEALILPSLVNNNRNSKNTDYLILYPNENRNRSGLPFGVGNEEGVEIKQFEWHYVNNNTTYHFRKGTYNYTVYLVIYNYYEKYERIPYEEYENLPKIIENLLFPTGTLITNKVNITISID